MPLHFALQKHNQDVVIEDLHRLSELDVRVHARTPLARLVAKALNVKSEDETEGDDNDNDEVRGLQPF